MPGVLVKKEMDHGIPNFSVPYLVDVLSDPPPLLSDLFGSENFEKMILIAKDKIEQSETYTPNNIKVEKKRPKQVKKEEELNLTGSPLKCSFTMDEEDDLDDFDVEKRFIKTSSSVGPRYVPITSMEARKCIGKYNLATQGSEISLPPCWTICDGDGGELFLGGRHFKTGLATYKVSWSGPHEKKDEELKLDYFLKKHHNCVAPSGTNVKNEFTAKAIYNLSEQLSGMEEEENQVGSDGSKLKVFLTWSRPRHFLERPPMQSVAEVNMEICPGDERVITHRLFKDLDLLQGFATGLSNQGITWRKPLLNEKTLQEEIESLICGMKEMGPRTSMANPASTVKSFDDSGEEELVSLVERTDMDLSDLLWNCLMKVDSYEQLANAILYILKTIQSAELRPSIYPKNGTKIVALVQEVIRGVDDLPEMAGKLPLEILVEIGIEKLQRDYVHSLLSNYLASREDLAPFLTTNHLSNCELSIANLSKLHIVQEVVCLAQMYLSPNQDCLRLLVQQALKQLKNCDNDFNLRQNRKFVFPIPSAFVKDQLAKTNPSIWQCRVVSKSPDLEVHTTAHLTLEPVSEFITLKSEVFDESSDKLDVSYYSTVASTIKRSGY